MNAPGRVVAGVATLVLAAVACGPSGISRGMRSALRLARRSSEARSIRLSTSADVAPRASGAEAVTLSMKSMIAGWISVKSSLADEALSPMRGTASPSRCASSASPLSSDHVPRLICADAGESPMRGTNGAAKAAASPVAT